MFFLFCFRTQHYDNLQKESNKDNKNNNNVSSQRPLKDNTNIQHVRTGSQTNGNGLTAGQEQTPSNVNGEHQLINNNSTLKTESESTSATTNKTDDKNSSNEKIHNKSSIKCLETLAQKAGIVFDETYEVANTLLSLDKQQSESVAVVQAVNEHSNQNGTTNQNGSANTNIVQQNLIVVDQNNQLHEFHNQAMAQIKQLVEASGWQFFFLYYFFYE